MGVPRAGIASRRRGYPWGPLLPPAMPQTVPAICPLLLLLAALAFAGPALAQDDAADDRRPPLFSVQDGDSRVYLLGSVHVLPEGALPLPAHVEAAYDQASVLAFELDLDLAQAGAQGMMAAAMDEETIGGALSPAQRDSLNAAISALGVPAGALDAFEPWFGGMTYGLMALQQAGLSVQGGGVDAHLFQRAGADGKERVAFETVEMQTAAFDDLPLDVQVRYLMESVASTPAELAEEFDGLLAAWGTGDDDGLAALMNDGMSQPELFDALLVRRNRAWIPQIEALLGRPGTALVVVGAGHLVGDQSVVDLLRQSGYAVERL